MGGAKLLGGMGCRKGHGGGGKRSGARGWGKGWGGNGGKGDGIYI